MAIATGVDMVGVGTAADMAIAATVDRALDPVSVADTSDMAEDAVTAMAMIVVMDGAASTKRSRRPAET